MKSDLNEAIIKECLSSQIVHIKNNEIENFPYQLIKNGSWNKELFNEEFFITFEDFDALREETKAYIKKFDNAPNDSDKLLVFLVPYMFYLQKKYGWDEVHKFLNI